MTTPSATPVRYSSGVGTDYPWQPLANYGNHNPFFYHVVSDDFDATFGAGAAGASGNGLWTTYTTAASGGTTVLSDALTGGNGEGGQILFTTGATSGNIQSIELLKASFILPPAVSLGMAYSSKKVFFLTRLNVTAIATTAWTTGLVNQSATPIILPTDGIFFTQSAAVTLTTGVIVGTGG